MSFPLLRKLSSVPQDQKIFNEVTLCSPKNILSDNLQKPKSGKKTFPSFLKTSVNRIVQKKPERGHQYLQNTLLLLKIESGPTVKSLRIKKF